MMRNTYYLLLIFLYVDDLLITERSTSSIATVKTTLHDRFSMIDMRLLSYFLSLQINQNDLGIKMYQSKYSINILNRFHMIDFHLAPTPFQSRVILVDFSASPLVDCTRYRKFMGSILYPTHT
jgi:hypothetical protein